MAARALTLPVLLLIVSGLLYTARSELGRVDAELRAAPTLRPFRVPVPDIAVTLHGDTATALPGLCRPGREVVVAFTGNRCRACEGILRPLDRLARETGGVVLLGIDGPPRYAPDFPGDVGVAVPGEVSERAGLSTVPSLLVLDPECRLRVAASGRRAARVLLQRLLDEASPTL